MHDQMRFTGTKMNTNNSLIESKRLFSCSGIMILKYKKLCTQSAIKT